MSNGRNMWEYQTLLELMEMEEMDNPIEDTPPMLVVNDLYCKCNDPKKVRSEAYYEHFWYCRKCKKEWKGD